MLNLPPPLEADPTGEFFCFQKRVVKDAELFDLDEAPDASEPHERGFADVWKKYCFAWEYKGKKKNLDEAYMQLLRYRESLLNPPLLVVCDFNRYIVKTNFNGTVQEVYEFTNAEIDRPENLRILRALFENPDFLKPQRTTAEVTEKLAGTIAEVAKSLQKREAMELADARTRAEMNFGQRKNLRIARFLNRIVFCFFAEDTGLLPKNLFSDLLKTGMDDLKHFARTLENLFAVMARGGHFGKDKIRHFNGHLFEESSVFELTEDELKKLVEASEADWQFIQPSIMGTLFQRALDESQRAALGAQYTGEPDIRDLVEPVLMAPLRREWAVLKASLLPALQRGKGTPADRDRLTAFLKQLRTIIVMDPACGSGNFLYVALQMLLDLEKEVLSFATQLGFRFELEVSVQQLRAIEINAYAFELAQVSVQIGFLQWRRDNGFDNDRSPVLQNLDGFQNEDALLVPHFRSKARTLKEAQAGEHAGDDALKFYTEREWPKCDVIVGNPPFLGDKFIRGELGDGYAAELRRIYGSRIPGQSDLCCYWFEKARELVETRKCKRAGLLATQGIRGGANREVLNRIKETGDIFFAESDRPWVLAGANVHVSMVGFDDGSEGRRVLDGNEVADINSNLAFGQDINAVAPLKTNGNFSFQGPVRVGDFDVSADEADGLLQMVNPHGKPNSDVIRPTLNGTDNVKRPRDRWVIDFFKMSEADASLYEKPFGIVKAAVKPLRDKSKREGRKLRWWQHGETGDAMRFEMQAHSRFLAMAQTAKYFLFRWYDSVVYPEQTMIVFCREGDFLLGILQSRAHQVWGLKLGTRLETRPRYTPTTCLETFPFPFPDDLSVPPPASKKSKPQTASGWEGTIESRFLTVREEPPAYHVGGAAKELTPAEHRAAIAAGAKELNELRERWLNPPEWTKTRTLEFPGTGSGPWSRYVDPKTVDAKTGIGTVRYPRLEPRDADCAAKLKARTLTKLYNERPAWLDLAHKKLDAAVAAAYGWPADLTDEQILEKLLALNLERAAEEAKAEKAKKPKTSRAKQGDEML